MDDASLLRITLEEFGEVAKAMNEGDEAGVNEEIVHTAACLLKWLTARSMREL